ncbi:MAG: PH domain-containing protein [Phycisphaerales bacterium]|nr:MAG: PH domain-containing protein [Phycisphaerales bacterium]
MQEDQLLRVHPAMFRSNPIGFIFTCALFLLGFVLLFVVEGRTCKFLCFIFPVLAGGVIFLVWWLKILGTTLTVTTKRTCITRGILSKRTSEVMHSDIRNIQTFQTFLQRILDVGYLAISSAGQSDIEVAVKGIPDPDGIKDLIDKYREG